MESVHWSMVGGGAEGADILEQHPGHPAAVLARPLQQPEHVPHQRCPLQGAPGRASANTWNRLQARMDGQKRASRQGSTLPSRPLRAPARLTSTQGKPAVRSSVSWAHQHTGTMPQGPGRHAKPGKSAGAWHAPHLGEAWERSNVRGQLDARKDAGEHLLRSGIRLTQQHNLMASLRPMKASNGINLSLRSP